MQRILTAIAVAGICVLARAEPPPPLPEFGSSAGQLLSPEEEKRIGRGLLHELRGQDQILDDPLIDDYLNDLGFRLVSASEKPNPDFVFFTVRSPQINAFAAPGGYVGVNTGLIAMTANEDELAAVLGHEIAHVTQHHLVRAYERIKNASLPITLAILGALLAAKGGNGDAAQAAVITGSALLQQKAIDFTRENEAEADRVGIGTMARAGYDPTGMADVFARMEKTLRSNNGEAPPEFLRTHPLNSTRVSEARARASAAASERARNRPPSAIDFALVRERSRVLGSDNSVDLADEYKRRIEQSPQQAGDPEHYGLALALIRQGRAEAAIPVLRPLVDRVHHAIAFDLAMAEAEEAAGKRGEAQARLAKLASDFPDTRAIQLAWSELAVRTGKAADAKQAQRALRPLLERNPEDAALQLAYARASELSGEIVRAGQAHAEVALLNGRLEDALNQLRALLKRDDVDYYQRARIEARIEEVTPYALEERRRRLKEKEEKQDKGNGLDAADFGGRACAPTVQSLDPWACPGFHGNADARRDASGD